MIFNWERFRTIKINDGNYYVSQEGYCPKGAWLECIGINPYMWSKMGDLAKNKIINDNLDVWVSLGILEAALVLSKADPGWIKTRLEELLENFYD